MSVHLFCNLLNVLLKSPSHSDEDHEDRSTSCKILSNSISVVGTWSKSEKYVIVTFILRCYYVAARPQLG